MYSIDDFLSICYFLNMNELIILGNNIRAERNRLHLSQEQLAQKANMQTHHISNIENGKFDIKFTTLLAIMNALDVPFEKLYSRESENK